MTTMKYKITHTTTYHYSDSVPVCHNIVHLTPRATASQTCNYHRLVVRPEPADISKRVDYFGNTATHFTITKAHRTLSVAAASHVEVLPRTLPDPAASPAWESVRDGPAGSVATASIDACQFSFESPHVPRLGELAGYARDSFGTGRPSLAALSDRTARIHADCEYDPTATTVSTPISEVFRLRRGVCQDLAHLEIGCLRALGLSARYVSGYLRTIPPPGKPRLVGADASHAWLSVFCGETGWTDVDPTNNTFPTTDHITLAWGRDFSDVVPVRGIFVGGGRHTVKVAVDVVPVGKQAAAG